jgi:sec-independent protein translocase protein TatC
VLGVLSLLGIVSPSMLWRFNRYAILIAFVAGAVLTPGDLVVGQIAMGASLTVLYNISILISFVVGRRRRQRDEGQAAVADGETPAATA